MKFVDSTFRSQNWFKFTLSNLDVGIELWNEIALKYRRRWARCCQATSEVQDNHPLEHYQVSVRWKRSKYIGWDGLFSTFTFSLAHLSAMIFKQKLARTCLKVLDWNRNMLHIKRRRRRRRRRQRWLREVKDTVWSHITSTYLAAKLSFKLYFVRYEKWSQLIDEKRFETISSGIFEMNDDAISLGC